MLFILLLQNLRCEENFNSRCFTPFFILVKEQFIYDLPDRLGRFIKSEAYADAVKFYAGAMPIFKVAHGDSSFQDLSKRLKEAKAILVKNLQGKLFSDSESMQVRAEAAAKLLEKFELSCTDIWFIPVVMENASPFAHELAIRAFQVIFPDSEKQLIKLAQDLVTKHFVINEEYAAKVAVKLYIRSAISHLMQDISDSLLKVLKGMEQRSTQYSLEVALDASPKALFQQTPIPKITKAKIHLVDLYLIYDSLEWINFRNYQLPFLVDQERFHKNLGQLTELKGLRI
ncbi:Vacuolar protein sorting-associated protein 51-like protein, partial [Mucuna pruriens]